MTLIWSLAIICHIVSIETDARYGMIGVRFRAGMDPLTPCLRNLCPAVRLTSCVGPVWDMNIHVIAWIDARNTTFYFTMLYRPRYSAIQL